MKLKDLARLIGGALTGDGDRIVRGAAPIESAGQDEVAFLANAKYEKHMQATLAGAVIVAADYKGAGTSLIRCKDPYFAFRQAMVAFYGFRRADFEGIDPRANVHPSAELAEGVRVAPFVTIAEGCRIGRDTVLYPGAYVGPNCRIGRDCILYPNVVLYDGTVLHDRVTIHAGTSIGHDGFGYATHKGEDGIVRHEKIPQAGWVELEDDVEIGACCAIDRAAMGPTVIGAGTKFSNLVAIGHGTRLGKHCLLVAQVGIAGSVVVGDYCAFAGQSGVVGHVRIGDAVRVGAQAGVTNDVGPGLEVLGSPAIPLTQAKRAMTSVSRLPRIRTELRKLAARLEAVRKHLHMPELPQEPPDREKDG
jgi:UDP-3-O-[3-hydroxymyristoyl] glucosamine N-acyltransferase